MKTADASGSTYASVCVTKERGDGVLDVDDGRADFNVDVAQVTHVAFLITGGSVVFLVFKNFQDRSQITSQLF
jgi:hypothetical protein